MKHEINRALVLAHAVSWLGTPFTPRAAVRDVGADCVGFVRGVYNDLTGVNVPAPRWNKGWARDGSEPITAGLIPHAMPIRLSKAKPGHIVTWRIGPANAAHVGILARDGGMFHSMDPGGVQFSPSMDHLKITSAWAMPCHSLTETGPLSLTVDDCLAVICPTGRGEAYAVITEMMTATPLGHTRTYPSRAAAVDHLCGIYPHIETVE